MGFQRQLIAVLDIEAENGQLSFPCDAAVQLPQGAGCRVAGIGQQRLAVQLTLDIDGIKYRTAHIHLAAHHQCRRRILQYLGNILNGAQIGGDILTAAMVRSQLWLFVLIVGFTIVYVAFRYQCQQDMILIDKLEKKLKDAKYRALASSSELTERCRESHVLELLKTNKDSTIQVADQPPYIIKIDGKR